MYSGVVKPTNVCHLVALPYPGRGHVNPLMNYCLSLASRSTDILITFVVTEEWIGFLASDPKPENFRFCSFPDNIIPPEKQRGADIVAFIEAVMTKMEAPFEQLLDRLETPPTIILADTFLFWAVGVGNRRDIPVASFWTMSLAIFSVFRSFHLFEQNGHFPINIQEKGDERVEYIPGISSTRLVDIPFLDGIRVQSVIRRTLEVFSWLPKAQFLLCTSTYELETQIADILKSSFSFPVYTIGPSIPCFQVQNKKSLFPSDDPNYWNWLDKQPINSVLYVSFGSYLSVSSAQIEEIVAGLCSSGVKFLWVARGISTELRKVCEDNGGFIVNWCDQLRVLSHSSVGGFWSHCGWNSVQEGVFNGVPFLTFPIAMDQMQNGRLIVEDWKIGWRVQQKVGKDEYSLVKRGEIEGVVRKFMDLQSDEQKEMRRRARGFEKMCKRAIAKGGSYDVNIDSFFRDISQL